ncbi:oligo-beta-mannoside-specific phosphotransferase enzyme IIB component [Lentilactobacillus sunkii]|jgi:PTS system cellobiose-specific IIB component|uniref:Oligo-beta-mannoside-specific phosphotransferase enzyme IIB component n=1 Tax=Lentilactobacillus sunkii TaxID=481719 RepID=A0A1E7XCZ1_9LACO|nr:PTS lactose transporter subunit IIB [Lentilactobacillus sunkii]OFA10990.1 oligo-beta-mannoside-specific phosphotransferase enzyme IIB component [Lentilactobacillus sunkii]
MKKVLVVCESGISSHFLVKAAQPFIELYDAQVELIPTNIDNVSNYLNTDIEFVLVAPQASYHDEELQKVGETVPVETIPDDIYGWRNGEKLVKFLMEKSAPVEAV